MLATAAARFAVVGHVEWCDFLVVDRLPRAGEIVHVADHFAEPAGGGAVAAVELARLGAAVDLFTALGCDRYGRASRRRLGQLGVDVRARYRQQPQRRAIVHLERKGERTITVVGSRLGPSGADPLPWRLLDGAAVYFTAGDAAAVSEARRAAVLVATARAKQTLAAAGVAIDVLVRSGRDPDERYGPGELDPSPRAVVTTLGAQGGTVELADGERMRWPAARVDPSEVVDTYGAGDCFAAGLTWALGRGYRLRDAIAVAARCGADCVRRRGPYGRAAGPRSDDPSAREDEGVGETG